MDLHITTPFGRRPVTPAQIRAQANADGCPSETTVHKWTVFRDIAAARIRLGLGDRALAVLDALLTFHPETALSAGEGPGLVVFPSNAALALRAHGIAEATLRRHLAALVEAGLLIRRDSPNGKRYVRRGQGGAIAQAYGFDLTPLVARAGEIAALAGEVRAEAQALRVARERVTLLRRDCVKLIQNLAGEPPRETSHSGAARSVLLGTCPGRFNVIFGKPSGWIRNWRGALERSTARRRADVTPGRHPAPVLVGVRLAWPIHAPGTVRDHQNLDKEWTWPFLAPAKNWHHRCSAEAR